jgi:hypothetical protein
LPIYAFFFLIVSLSLSNDNSLSLSHQQQHTFSSQTTTTSTSPSSLIAASTFIHQRFHFRPRLLKNTAIDYQRYKPVQFEQIGF